jgi:hypothetical protein
MRRVYQEHMDRAFVHVDAMCIEGPGHIARKRPAFQKIEVKSRLGRSIL